MDVSKLHADGLREKLKELNKELVRAPEKFDFGPVADVFRQLRVVGEPQEQYLIDQQPWELSTRISVAVSLARQRGVALPGKIHWIPPEKDNETASLADSEESYYQRRRRRSA